MPKRIRVSTLQHRDGQGFATTEGGDTVHLCNIEGLIAEPLEGRPKHETGPLEGTSLCGRPVVYVGRPGLDGDELICLNCLKARKESVDHPGE